MDQPRIAPADEYLRSPAVESFARMAERMTDGVVLVSASQHITFCNTAFARLLGQSRDAMQGATVTRLLTEASRDDFEDHWVRRRQGDNEAYDLCWLRPDGTTVLTTVLPSALFTPSGEFDGAVAVVSDKTEHERISTELSIARRIVANGASILYRVRVAPGFPLEYVSSNVERYGYSTDMSLSFGTWHAAIYGDDRERVLKEFNDRLAARSTNFQQTYRICTASGDIVWMEDQAIVEYGRDGHPVRIEGLLTDVTDRRRSQHEVRHALAQTIRAIGAVTDIRDPYTGIHQRRVADLSMAMGRALDLDPERLEGLFLGALVHDVGKVSIPIDVLSKPSKLTAEETALVRTHVRAGVQLLDGIKLPWKIVDIIAQHHERLDGSGYPAGLTAPDILLESRIVSVADVFEAMFEHRPYRPARGGSAAIEELKEQAGRRFDPIVVDACLDVLARHGAADGGLWASLAREETEDSTVILRAPQWGRLDTPA